MQQATDQSPLFSEHITTSIDIFTCILEIVGIVGNVVSFAFLLRYVGNTSTFIILRALAVSNTVFLLCHLLFQLATYYDILWVHKTVKYVGYTYIGHVAITATVWTTVVLSAERLVAVKYPLRHHVVFSYKRTILSIVLLWIASTVLRLPGFLQRILQSKRANNYNASNYYANLTESNATATTSSSDGMQQLQTALWSIEAIVSILIVCCFNLVIVVAIVKHVRQQSADRKFSKEIQATKVPLLIVTMFLLSELPKKICGALLRANAVRPSYVDALVAICDVCTVINSSTNIIIYIVGSSNVRRKLLAVVLHPISGGRSSCCGYDLTQLEPADDTTVAQCISQDQQNGAAFEMAYV